MKSDNNKKIYIAGHTGMVGSAIYLDLTKNGYNNLITIDSKELDLRNQAAVNDFFKIHCPEVVIIAAAKVGGILANNQYPWDFLYDNLVIETNLIYAAHKNNVQDLIFLGSSCIYPKYADQPLKESYLLTGVLEPTNEWYAIAKISGIKLCQALNKQFDRNFISLMPTNLYGERDNFDLNTSHVLPAMIRKFHDAKLAGNFPVELWGTGTPKREFLHVEDLANAVRFVLENKVSKHYDLLNVGTGVDLTIKSLAKIIQKVVGHNGDIHWDETKPDGVMRKLLDVSRMEEMGWKSTIDLELGIKKTYNWFLENSENFKQVQLNKKLHE